MKVTIKTLSNEVFEVETDLAHTVGQLKESIQALKGMEASAQKLIYAGKVLKDEVTLQDSGVKEGGFIVCMVSKKTTSAAPAAAAPAPAAAAPAPAAAAPAPAPAPAASAPAPAPAAADPFTGPEFESKVSQLKDMGFPDAEVRAALRAAFGNADRAVEYLMTGIPPAAATGAAPAHAAPAGMPGTGGGRPLDVLRSHPQFNQLKRLIQENPAALPTVLAQIGAASPQLLQLINEHRDEFVAMMNEPVEEDDEELGDEEGEGDEDDEMGEGGPNPAQLAMVAQMLAGMSAEQRAAMAAQMGIPVEQLQMMAQMGAALGAQGGGAPGAPPPGATVIRLTPEEAEAVKRLEGLGFSRQRVLEAYLACDKNEELAANYLLENGMDDS